MDLFFFLSLPPFCCDGASFFFFQGRAHGNKNFQPVFIVEQRHIYLSIYIYIYIYKEDQSASFLIHFSLLFMLLSLSLSVTCFGEKQPVVAVESFFLCVCIFNSFFFFYCRSVTAERCVSSLSIYHLDRMREKTEEKQSTHTKKKRKREKKDSVETT